MAKKKVDNGTRNRLINFIGGVFDYEFKSPNDVAVLFAILSCYNLYIERACPTRKTIAEKSGCSLSQVIESLKRLRSMGIIDWVSSNGAALYELKSQKLMSLMLGKSA